MKKNGILFSLLFALTAVCATGCDVKTKKENGSQVLFEVNGTKVTADDLLGFNSDKAEHNLLSTDSGVAAAYQSVLGSLAKANIVRDAVIDLAVKTKMEAFEEEVESYASANSVTKRSAQKTLLEEKGFETKDELKESYYVAEQVSDLLEGFETTMMEKSTGTEEKDFSESLVYEYVKNTHPMIVKHILTKVADSHTIYHGASIEESEVELFLTVLQRLAVKDTLANSFKNIAIEESEDGSASKGGSLGIVDTYTSFVPEFKEGLYASEILEEEDADKKADLAEAYGVDLDKLAATYADECGEIDVIALGSVLSAVYQDENSALQKQHDHNKESEYDSDLFPRNILFNHYLNTPKVQYLFLDNETNLETRIKNLIVEAYQLSGTSDEKVGEIYAKVLNTSFYKALVGEGATLTSEVEDNIILENGRKLIVAKSSYGFHFIARDFAAMDCESDNEAAKFFMYKTSSVGTSDVTYVNQVKSSDSSTYTGYTTSSSATRARQSEIKDRVLNYLKGGFESLGTSEELYEHRVFNYYLENTENFSIKSDAVKAEIEEMINTLEISRSNSIKTAQENTWESYMEQIEAYDEMYALYWGI